MALQGKGKEAEVKLSPEKIKEIIRAAERFRERVEAYEEEQIWETAQRLGLEEKTVRKIWEDSI